MLNNIKNRVLVLVELMWQVVVLLRILYLSCTYLWLYALLSVTSNKLPYTTLYSTVSVLNEKKFLFCSTCMVSMILCIEILFRSSNARQNNIKHYFYSNYNFSEFYTRLSKKENKRSVCLKFYYASNVSLFFIFGYLQ